jgi:hypothetical protein
MPERVAIVGSRGYPRLDLVREYVGTLGLRAIVVTGGAAGVDQTAEERALERGMQVSIHVPDWDRWGKRAGLLRNAKIVADCDRLVAFWDGQSSGTRDSIEKALTARMDVVIMGPGGGDIDPRTVQDTRQLSMW